MADLGMNKTEDFTGWYDAGPAESIALESAIVLPLMPPVAVYRIEDGYFATDDTCSHSEYSLGDGWIEGGTVECELHAAKFDIKTGAALTLPATDPVATYPVEVVDGNLYVDLRGREGCIVEQLRG
jgi:3-phenylpropionate/trans-cinnamate dioxygenase ferredoxin component